MSSISLKIWDSPPDLLSRNDLSIPEVDVVLFVYNVMNRSTYNDIENMIKMY